LLPVSIEEEQGDKEPQLKWRRPILIKRFSVERPKPAARVSRQTTIGFKEKPAGWLLSRRALIDLTKLQLLR
jgi:hypothetical protein